MHRRCCLPAAVLSAAGHRTRDYRIDRQFRRDWPHPLDGDFSCPAGRVRSCQRDSRGGVGQHSQRRDDADRRGRDRRGHSMSVLRRHRPDVHGGHSCPTRASDHARRDEEPRSYVVHHHGSADVDGRLHVAARVRQLFYRKERRYAATQRRGNAAYTISLAFIVFAGFSAVLIVPGLANGDLALLTVVRRSFPPWLLGLIGGAGALTAMVPAAILVLTAATLFAKNLWRPIFAPAMADAQVARLARAMVVVLSLVSLWLAIYSSSTLVALLLLGYAGVTQFFPGVVLGLYWNRASTVGVFAGLVAGIAIATLLILSDRDPYLGWSAGFLGLCANFLIAIVISGLRQYPVHD